MMALDPGGQKGERHQGAGKALKGEDAAPKMNCQILSFLFLLERTASFFGTRLLMHLVCPVPSTGLTWMNK